MEIRIEGTELPGRECGGSPGFPGYENIHVAIQRRGARDDLVGLTPGDAPSVRWTLPCDLIETANGVDFKGRCIQGPPGARFVYITWGTVDAAGTFDMFRRAKVWLDAINPAVLAAAQRSQRLVARLGLTDDKGHPRCAAVRPPLVTWSARCTRPTATA